MEKKKANYLNLVGSKVEDLLQNLNKDGDSKDVQTKKQSMKSEPETMKLKPDSGEIVSED